MPVPLPARAEFAGLLGGPSPRLLTLEEGDGRVSAAIALHMLPSRALPGHRLARAHHCGVALVGSSGDALLAGLADLARNDVRMLRLSVEVVLRRPEDHARLEAGALAAGFAKADVVRNYRDTLVIDLEKPVDQILGSLSATTRREIRSSAERPIEVCLIRDARFSERLNEIGRETVERTGGKFHSQPWADRIALSRVLPNASRIVGLFLSGRDDPAALLAFAWGCAHGDHAHYAEAGSTRASDSKGSLMYPLMWDLVQWAKGQGCSWFDMGGVTTRSDGDPLGGISDFKRRFSKTVATVGAEWVIEPHPRRAALAEEIRQVAARLRTLTNASAS